MAVELHLLGPVEATVEGEVIHLTRLRTRQLLALLGIGFAALAFGSMPIPQGASTASVSMLWLILA